jgi:hypothetical protein
MIRLAHTSRDERIDAESDGGGVLDQSVLTRPKFVSWKETLPALCGASGGLFWPSVVQARTKLEPLWLLTVIASFVGVVL